jgi:hypothetical protein
MPQLATPWLYTFPNGVNFAHADCNGDGIVNYYYDAFPIYVNYGLQRPDLLVPDQYVSGLPGIDPPLYFDTTNLPQTLVPGQSFSLPIMLGTAQLPAEDLYGIAFSLHLDTAFFEANDVAFQLNEPSWANPDNDRVFMHKTVSAGRIDLAWVRTDHNQVDGFGRIGNADFIIIIDVVDLQRDIRIRMDSIRMIDRFGNQMAVAGDTVTLRLSADSQIVQTPEPGKLRPSVQPNPAQRLLRVLSPEPLRQICLLNALGQPVFRQAGNAATALDLQLPELPDGMYFLEISTENQTRLEKIQIRQ